jgi:hypothetical protein
MNAISYRARLRQGFGEVSPRLAAIIQASEGGEKIRLVAGLQRVFTDFGDRAASTDRRHRIGANSN